MAITLTKEEFIKRIHERETELDFPIDKIKASGADKRIFSQNERGINVNLSETMAYYLANLIEVVYREP